MLTGDQYRKSLRDGRAAYLDGKRVDDVTQNPLLSVSIDWVAKTYDAHHSTAARARNPMFALPATPAELRDQMGFFAKSDFTAATTAGCMSLREILPQLGKIKPAYRQRLEQFLDRCEREDLRVASAVEDGGITDAGKLRIVERRDDGIVLRGAKRHVLGASIVHELLVVPAGALSKEHSDAAIACAVAPNTAGLKIVNTTTAPRAEDDRHYPVSREFSVPDCYVMFEVVFVPAERVFLCGETEFAGAIVDTLGVWERARSASDMADRAELVLGLAQTIAEMNGVDKIEHIRNKLSMIAVWASMCRAGWDRALANAKTTASGTVRPDDSAVYATKAYGGERYNDMLSYLHDISGALVLTVPATADYDNQATHKYMEKYLRTMDGVTGEARMKIFHLIRDLTADQYGGWKKVTEQMIGGGLIAQRMNALDHYPLEHVKAKARASAKITPREGAADVHQPSHREPPVG
ncbi:MAG TPA: 4-hydroxyphenylacetate 3-hydroxylase C-terminal domain-containing protein [Pseudomonadales bacterium]